MNSSSPGPNSNFDDPHTQTFATENVSTVVAKKKNPVIKAVIILGSIALVAVVGLVGWGFFMGPKTPPARVEAVAKPAAKPSKPAEAPKPAEDPAVTAAPAIDPNAPTDPNALAVAPLDPNAPVLAAPVDPNAPAIVPVDPNAPAVAPVVDPAAAAAVVQPGQVAVVTPASPTQAPAVEVVPQPAPAVQAPPVAIVNDPAASGIAEAMNAARAEMNSALNRIENRLSEMESRFNARFNAVENRVSQLEGRPAGSTPAVAPVRRAPVKKRAPVAPRAPATNNPPNHLEILDSSAAPAVQPAIMEGGAPVEMDRIEILDAPPVAAAHAAAASCRIQAIQPGRAWVRQADGSFTTYRVGDVLPNGRTVDSIDPDAGVMAGGSVWNC